MVRRVFAAVFVAAFCVQARANTANFDALAAGTMYSPGGQFSNGGLDFDVLFGLSPLKVATASPPVNLSFTGNYLNFPSNVALNINLPTGATQIQFDFILGDPATALVIDGAFLDYDLIPATINGVTVTHLLGSKATPWGSISMRGDINTFAIIGTAFSVDNLNATLAPGIPGDYNKNHVADAADYVVWRNSINTPSGYHSWRNNFGATGAGTGDGARVAIRAVPEPLSLASALLGLPLIAAFYRQRVCANRRAN